MKFTKMHGLGNDYVLANGADERIDDPSALARAVSDRHTGIGSDGLILIQPSTVADVRMEMYNADGSRPQMCGNGLRCVAKYAVDHELTRERTIRVETDSGIKTCECHVVDGKVGSVRVDMGQPSLAVGSLPSTIALDRIVNHRLKIGGHDYVVTCVSMGNPHAVVFVDDLGAIELEVVGPQFEHAPEFPERINVHFARVDSPNHVTMRTWERGSGITQACGTGACAVCVAGAITERTHRSIVATLAGGDLEIGWSDNNHVYMTGPAVAVFTGDWL